MLLPFFVHLPQMTLVGLPSHLPDDALKCANLICFFFNSLWDRAGI